LFENHSADAPTAGDWVFGVIAHPTGLMPLTLAGFLKSSPKTSITTRFYCQVAHKEDNYD
jgi:hypothetical protein